MVEQRTRPRRTGERRYFPRRKVCAFCVDKVVAIDYKEVAKLRRYVTEWGKIEPRRKSGACAPHQRDLAVAIKRARQVGMLPFTGSHTLIELGRPESPRGDRWRSNRPDRGPSRYGSAPSARPTDGTPSAREAGAAPTAAVAVAIAAPEAAQGAPAEHSVAAGTP